ncbi:MAG TPA: outer membrane protein assembly factor BamE [Burkholderiales bacterium]|nr:outer membrane protein assembly factor BamE [Burkholderiales bacterium]
MVAGCASYSGYTLQPGASSAEVEATMGKPALVREAANGEKTWWYPRFPFGRESYAARLSPDGRLIALEQRLTPQNIARIVPNKSTSEEVLDVLGPPSDVYRYPRQQREAWEYPLFKPPQSRSLYVQISPDKVVREVYELEDRAFDPFLGIIRP